MSTLAEIWQENKAILAGKTIGQVIAFIGDGVLTDSTAGEFRDFLRLIPNELVFDFIEQCLDKNTKLDKSGYALQDLVNECGVRLGFEVTPGLYRGRHGKIGFDGIWNIGHTYDLVVEIKTTDAYRINLDKIASYREQLIGQQSIEEKASSILILVGREDTGDLEAQIRGSKYAWSIRLISIDALVRMLRLKNTVNDSRILLQIAEILKPMEYTRLDKLVELIAIASEDSQPSCPMPEEDEDGPVTVPVMGNSQQHAAPVYFNQECVSIVAKRLDANFVQHSKISYADSERSLGIACAVSKLYEGTTPSYWFAFHDYQIDFLSKYETAYVVFGCGSPSNLLLMPFKAMLSLIENMHSTNRNNRRYWHVFIIEKKGHFYIRQPLAGRGKTVDVTSYKIENNNGPSE